MIIKRLERQQTKELAHEHGTGLHKRMLEGAHLAIGTLRFDVICPSRENWMRNKMYSIISMSLQMHISAIVKSIVNNLLGAEGVDRSGYHEGERQYCLILRPGHFLLFIAIRFYPYVIIALCATESNKKFLEQFLAFQLGLTVRCGVDEISQLSQMCF